MIRLLSRLLRRHRVVLVDEDALRQLRELAVLGAAYEIVEAESERWHSLDC